MVWGADSSDDAMSVEEALGGKYLIGCRIVMLQL